jgi:hypothetical protein
MMAAATSVDFLPEAIDDDEGFLFSGVAAAAAAAAAAAVVVAFCKEAFFVDVVEGAPAVGPDDDDGLGMETRPLDAVILLDGLVLDDDAVIGLDWL